jgi:hypothetical protein
MTPVHDLILPERRPPVFATPFDRQRPDRNIHRHRHGNRLRRHPRQRHLHLDRQIANDTAPTGLADYSSRVRVALEHSVSRNMTFRALTPSYAGGTYYLWHLKRQCGYLRRRHDLGLGRLQRHIDNDRNRRGCLQRACRPSGLRRLASRVHHPKRQSGTVLMHDDQRVLASRRRNRNDCGKKVFVSHVPTGPLTRPSLVNGIHRCPLAHMLVGAGSRCC